MAKVEHVSYPGGPSGLAARLDRHDLGAYFRSSAKWAWSAIPVLAIVGVICFHLSKHPSLYALLGVFSFGFAIMALLLPVITVLNLWMSTYYFDQRWIALYLGSRLGSVDLTTVNKVTARPNSFDGSWHFSSPEWTWRGGVRVPDAIMALDDVRRIVWGGLSWAQLNHQVVLDERALKVFPRPAFGAYPYDSTLQPFPTLARPPYRGWPGVYGSGTLRPSRKRAQT